MFTYTVVFSWYEYIQAGKAYNKCGLQMVPSRITSGCLGNNPRASTIIQACLYASGRTIACQGLWYAMMVIWQKVNINDKWTMYIRMHVSMTWRHNDTTTTPRGYETVGHPVTRTCIRKPTTSRHGKNENNQQTHTRRVKGSREWSTTRQLTPGTPSQQDKHVTATIRSQLM